MSLLGSATRIPNMLISLRIIDPVDKVRGGGERVFQAGRLVVDFVVCGEAQTMELYVLLLLLLLLGSLLCLCGSKQDREKLIKAKV